MPVRFIVYADSETEPESTDYFTSWVDPVSGSMRQYLIDQTTGYQNNLAVMKQRHPDIIFVAGDLVETGGEQRDWDEFWRHNTNPDNERSIAGEIPILAALGNHEYYEGPYFFVVIRIAPPYPLEPYIAAEVDLSTSIDSTMEGEI